MQIDREKSEADLLEKVRKLPCTAELEIPEDYLDSNGHVNMMYYTLIGNLSWKTFFEMIGLPRERFMANNHSTFALRQVISYLNELKEGDRVAVYGGLVGYDQKRIHFIYYIVNQDTNRIASIDERVILYVDMVSRRSAKFAQDMLDQLEKARRDHAALGWKPELSGAIVLKN